MGWRRLPPVWGPTSGTKKFKQGDRFSPGRKNHLQVKWSRWTCSRSPTRDMPISWKPQQHRSRGRHHFYLMHVVTHFLFYYQIKIFFFHPDGKFWYLPVLQVVVSIIFKFILFILLLLHSTSTSENLHGSRPPAPCFPDWSESKKQQILQQSLPSTRGHGSHIMSCLSLNATP